MALQKKSEEAITKDEKDENFLTQEEVVGLWKNKVTEVTRTNGKRKKITEVRERSREER